MQQQNVSAQLLKLKKIHYKNKPSHKRKEEIPMNNKYLFDQNKEILLKNTELDIAEAKKIPADQLSDYSNAVSECDEIMEERKKDESNYMERMKEFLQKLFATKDNPNLHPEIKKMYRKLYHAIAYQEDAINKMNDSAEIMGQICADLCVIYRK